MGGYDFSGIVETGFVLDADALLISVSNKPGFL